MKSLSRSEKQPLNWQLDDGEELRYEEDGVRVYLWQPGEPHVYPKVKLSLTNRRIIIEQRALLSRKNIPILVFYVEQANVGRTIVTGASGWTQSKVSREKITVGEECGKSFVEFTPTGLIKWENGQHENPNFFERCREVGRAAARVLSRW